MATLKELIDGELAKGKTFPIRICDPDWKNIYVDLIAATDLTAVGFFNDGLVFTMRLNANDFELYTEPKKTERRFLYAHTGHGACIFASDITDLNYTRTTPEVYIDVVIGES